MNRVGWLVLGCALGLMFPGDAGAQWLRHGQAAEGETKGVKRR